MSHYTLRDNMYLENFSGCSSMLRYAIARRTTAKLQVNNNSCTIFQLELAIFTTNYIAINLMHLGYGYC